MENKQKMKLTESLILKGKSQVKQRNDRYNGIEVGCVDSECKISTGILAVSSLSLGSDLLFVP